MIKPLKSTSLMDIPNETIMEVQIYKKHGGHVGIILVAPNGDFKEIMSWSLNAQPLIDQNMKDENLKSIPKNWPTDHHIFPTERSKIPPEK